MYLQSVLQENFPRAPVQPGHFDRIRALVAPVQIPGDPVHRNPIGVVHRGRMENLHVVRRVTQAPPVDGTGGRSDVGIKEALCGPLKVQRHRVGQVSAHEKTLLALEADIADEVFIGVEQRGLNVGNSLTRTTAVEGRVTVGTDTCSISNDFES